MMQLIDPGIEYSDSRIVAIRMLQYPLGWVPFAAGASMLMFGQMVRRRPVGEPADDNAGPLTADVQQGSGPSDKHGFTASKTYVEPAAPVLLLAVIGFRLSFLAGLAAAVSTAYPNVAAFRYVAWRRTDALTGEDVFVPLSSEQEEAFLRDREAFSMDRSDRGSVVDSAMGEIPSVLLTACVGVLALSTMWGVVGALAMDMLLRNRHLRRSICCGRMHCLACMFPWRCCGCTGAQSQSLPGT